MDFGVGQAGVVIDRGVHVFVAHAGCVAGGEVLGAAAAVDPPAAAVTEPADLLDVDVDEFAGAGAFVAADELAGGPVQPGQPVQTVPDEDGVHGRGGQPVAAQAGGTAEWVRRAQTRASCADVFAMHRGTMGRSARRRAFGPP